MRARVATSGLVALFACRAPAPAAPPAAPAAPIAIAPDAAPMPDAPLPLDRDPAALVAREVDLYERVAAAVATDAPCAERAAAIDALAPDAAPVIAARRAMLAAGLGEARDAALATDRPRLAALVDRIAQASAACAPDAGVERALDHTLAP